MTAGQQLQYGLLLPHFGSYATRAAVLDGARRAEQLGFDSVWVRDHLVYHPHAHEDPDRTHIDPLVTLAAVAGVTERLILGAGTLIPHRHPIHTALLLGSLERLAGPGRVIAAFGIGAFGHEFEAIGMGGLDRRDLIEEQIRLMRRLLTGEEIDVHEGRFYSFTKVAIQPVPADGGGVPLWYGGSSPAAVRRAAEYCDGWLASRTPRRDLRKRVARLARFAEEHNRPQLPVGVIPYVSPAPTVEEGTKAFNLPALFADSARMYELPASGAFTSLEELDGAAIAGPADVIVEHVRAYQAEGVSHFVFDLRARFRDWSECLEMLGTEVLPTLRRENGESPGSGPSA
jgi:alkanesulfonate monooxygenase SsuD/methylene tetrahydromethanopterin reductase-like flavin-dependent oxidoreductase (luciferase family)